MTSIGLIGCGGMAQDVVAALRSSDKAVQIVGALARPGRSETAREKLCGIEIVETLDALFARRPKIIAEVASQGAVSEYGERVLRSGVDFLIISIGGLADPTVLKRLKSAAQEGNSRILLPAGAIGGIDAIAAMRLGGLAAVRYRSRKPPAAWRGTPAEQAVDLAKLTGRTVLYQGKAGDAALRYPQNANVAATVALAGLDSRRPKRSSSPIPMHPAMCTRSKPRAPRVALPSRCRANPRAPIQRHLRWRR